MAFSQTVLLLPCHSLEDFPTHYEGEEAAGLLAAWCCAWHPVILAATGALPQWNRADDPPEDLDGKLIVIPSLSQAELPTGFVKKAREAGATVVQQGDFPTMVQQSLAGLKATDSDDEQLDGQRIPEETVEDFFALAYVYLQIELLTRQMRYACNLDEAAFSDEAIAAARFAVDGDATSTFDRLSRCFDLIAEERDHYYSVEAYLFDITLVAPTTIGAGLRKQLESETPTTLLLSGSTLELIADKTPDLIGVIRQAWEAGRIAVAGGDYHEDIRFPLLSHEEILSELERGVATFERLLGRRPKVYGRRTTGLTPILPQILSKLGYEAAFHFAIDEGQVPQSGQAKLRWEGLDGTAIDVLGRPPLDANRAETFLSFAMKMGESMDMDFVATVALAHWPNQTQRWHESLRRSARYGQSLGRFVTADQYFEESSSVGHNDRFDSDRYTNSYLRQDIIRNVKNPLSCVADGWRAELQREMRTAIWVAAESVGGSVLEDRDGDPAKQLGQALTKPGNGVLVVNPLPITVRLNTEPSSLSAAPTAGGYVYGRENEPEGKRTVVDVPAVGFAWMEAGDGPSTTQTKKSLWGRPKEPGIAEDGMLRNEFFELRVHPETGGVQSMTPFDSRTNLCTQQLGVRLGEKTVEPGQSWQDPDDLAVYTQMVAQQTKTIASSPIYGAIESQGRLVKPNGETVAEFRQQVSLWRGSRIVELNIELDLQEKLRADPWKSYVANRLAWGDEGATVTRNFHEIQQAVDGRRIAAPLYLQIDNGSHKVCVLPNGLPYHRLTGLRMLDTLLMVRGESRCSFKLALGVNIPQPYFAACQSMLDPTLVSGVDRPTPDHAWLFHLGARNVTATHWESIAEGGKTVGVRCRLLETAGNACRAKVAASRNLTSARILDFRGEPMADCPLDDGKAVVEMTPYEWSQVEMRWIG
jgi:alpha-mannosidase